MLNLVEQKKGRYSTEEKKELTAEIKKFAQGRGADIVGIASVESLSGAPQGRRPMDLLPGAKTVIVVGLANLREMLVTAPSRPFTAEYDMCSDRGDAIAFDIAHGLAKQKHKAFYIPNFIKWDARAHICEFSHKHAAQKAGIGSFGRNNLILHPEFGPAISLTSIITDAPLVPDSPFKDKLCTECNLCVQQCPVDAILKEYDPVLGGGHLPVRCFDRCIGLISKDPPYGKNRICNICVKVCPVGNRRRKKLKK
jgi:epoxyqueuosine reductase